MTQGGWGRDPKERVRPEFRNVLTPSFGGSNTCWEGFREEEGFALHPEGITQAKGNRKGHARQKVRGGKWGQGRGAYRSQGQVGASWAFVQQAFGS